MGTLKKIIGIGAVTGVVVYAYLRSLSGKVGHRLPEPKNENPQLI